MQDFLPLILQLFSGAVGANLAGTLVKTYSLGTMWNSIVGIVGGGLGGSVLGFLNLQGINPASTDLVSIIAGIAVGLLGGGVILTVIGVIRSARNQ